MSTPKISVMMSTVRNNYPYIHHPKMYIFDPTLESLQQQTFKEFEFVLVDYRKDMRKKFDNKYNFNIKHEKPKESIWDKMRYPAIYNGFNSAILNSNGELCILIGDCCKLNPDFLSKCWQWYKKGFFVAGIVEIENNYRDDTVLRKNILSRYLYQNKNFKGNYCPIQGRYATWGYNSYTLKSLLDVNGFDENFDGSNRKGDEDIGVRLELLGHKFILDGNLKAFEYHHNNPVAVRDYLCGKKSKDNNLYFDSKWSYQRKKQLIFANNGFIEGKKFKDYEDKDFYAVRRYHKDITQYSRLRDMYIYKPSNFNLKKLWQIRNSKI